jgi:dipeptidyl aminopeptidase/acylaminoacyl peptidase
MHFARRARRLGGLVIAGCALIFAAAVVTLAEQGLRVPAQLRVTPEPELAEDVSARSGAGLESVEIVSSDGLRLRGWYFEPPQPNGATVMLLHGVADSRRGMMRHARFLLDHGFSVLAADSRAHGSSEGTLFSYGIREVDDVRRWANWLFEQKQTAGLHGLGVSMGAAILLQTIEHDSRFRAVVADSPFATFREVAYDRLNLVLGTRNTPLAPLCWGLLTPAFLYTRWRQGIDLDRVSPLRALAATRIPVLLMHSPEDANVPFSHSRKLQTAREAGLQLWEMPGARHGDGLHQLGAEYERRVLDWFRRYSPERDR